jgi:5'-nucleotidase
MMMKQLSWRILILAGALAVGVASSTAAQATDCTGTLAPGSYDTLTVPAGALCFISSGTVTVAGNVTVAKAGFLGVGAPARFTVNGSLLAVDPTAISIVPQPMGAVNILGSISVTGTTDFVRIEEAFVAGALSVTNSSGEFVELFGDNAAGSVLIRNNETGQNVITGNTIGGSLVCSGNTPAPVDQGEPNTVGGNKVGQCSGL